MSDESTGRPANDERTDTAPDPDSETDSASGADPNPGLDPVREVVLNVPQPWTARQVAMAAGTRPGETADRLEAMLAADELVAFDGERGRLYYPDPVFAYLDATGGPPAGPREKAAVSGIRTSLTQWAEGVEITSVQGLLRYHHAARLVTSSRLGRGVDAFETDWDVLVVLDTCRVDALRDLLDPDRETPLDVELDLDASAADVEDRLSLASQTAEWLCATFTTDRRAELARTGYVSGNGWTKAVFADGLRPDDDSWFRDLSLPTTWDVVDRDAFGALVDAWRYSRGEYSRAVPWEPHPDPETVTDHAIALARDRPDLDRLVVHYKQPHAPYTVAAERADRTDLTQVERAPFDYIAEGGDRADVWTAYLTDLAAALAGVAELRRNVDGTVAVTADHGEAFGEGGEYGHRPAMLHPHVRRVPWLELSATDEGTRDPDLSAYEDSDRDVDAQLEALGYR